MKYFTGDMPFMKTLADALSAPFARSFVVDGKGKSLHVSGLETGEVGVLQSLVSDISDADLNDPSKNINWINVSSNGVAVQVTEDNNVLNIPTKGVYRLKVLTALGPITVAVSS